MVFCVVQSTGNLPAGKIFQMKTKNARKLVIIASLFKFFKEAQAPLFMFEQSFMYFSTKENSS